MKLKDKEIFSQLYELSYRKCFNHKLLKPLSETESKFFENKINTSTGLVIGWRTLKNYSIHLLNPDKSRDENPSLATMDTLARYVLNAPYTNEIDRKNKEAHHPYWFRFKEEKLKAETLFKPEKKKANSYWWLTAATIVAILVTSVIAYQKTRHFNFNYNFVHNTDEELQHAGWVLLHKNSIYWKQKQSTPGSLTLFTLPGDNWPQVNQHHPIENLLIKELTTNCFIAELQMKNFIPTQEWQQAGLLLLNDTTANSPALRLSLGYNDLFGGNKRSPEIIVQGIILTDNKNKPEEFVHLPVLTLDSLVNKSYAAKDLSYSAIRIEKTGRKCRMLFSSGSRRDGAFKEVATKDLPFEPNYAAIFAIKGDDPLSKIIPVKLLNFSLKEISCQ